MKEEKKDENDLVRKEHTLLLLNACSGPHFSA